MVLAPAGAIAQVGTPPAAPRTAVLQDLVVDGPVPGDILVVMGDLTLTERARVEGHAVAVLGTIQVEPGAVVEGRVLAVSSLGALTLHPTAGDVDVLLTAGVRLLSVGGWLLLTTAVAVLFPVRVRLGTWAVGRLGIRVALLGVLAAATLIAAFVAAVGLGVPAGVPVAAAVFLLFFAVKAVGLAVVGGLLGALLAARLLHRGLPLSVHVFTGVLLLLLCRLVPFLGGSAWTVISIVALGAGVFALAQERPLEAGSPA